MGRTELRNLVPHAGKHFAGYWASAIRFASIGLPGASKLCRSPRPELSRTAGFTLLEALVALAVMGAGLAAIGALANSSLHVGLYTERHLRD